LEDNNQEKRTPFVSTLVDAGKPCNFDDLLTMFLPYRADIEDENGYSVAALVMGIRANFGVAA
jgi:hypothetical protein